MEHRWGRWEYSGKPFLPLLVVLALSHSLASGPRSGARPKPKFAQDRSRRIFVPGASATDRLEGTVSYFNLQTSTMFIIGRVAFASSSCSMEMHTSMLAHSVCRCGIPTSYDINGHWSLVAGRCSRLESPIPHSTFSSCTSTPVLSFASPIHRPANYLCCCLFGNCPAIISHIAPLP